MVVITRNKRMKFVDMPHNGILVRVYGGPYTKRPKGGVMPTIKLAPEVPGEYTYLLSIPDFGTPTEVEMERALLHAVGLLSTHKRLYVGCRGGMGRTGMFIALLYRVFNERKRDLELGHTPFCGSYDFDPVRDTRDLFTQYAIETDEQETLVRHLDIHRIKTLARFL